MRVEHAERVATLDSVTPQPSCAIAPIQYLQPLLQIMRRNIPGLYGRVSSDLEDPQLSSLNGFGSRPFSAGLIPDMPSGPL